MTLFRNLQFRTCQPSILSRTSCSLSSRSCHRGEESQNYTGRTFFLPLRRPHTRWVKVLLQPTPSATSVEGPEITCLPFTKGKTETREQGCSALGLGPLSPCLCPRAAIGIRGLFHGRGRLLVGMKRTTACSSIHRTQRLTEEVGHPNLRP